MMYGWHTHTHTSSQPLERCYICAALVLMLKTMQHPFNTTYQTKFHWHQNFTGPDIAALSFEQAPNSHLATQVQL